MPRDVFGAGRFDRPLNWSGPRREAAWHFEWFLCALFFAAATEAQARWYPGWYGGYCRPYGYGRVLRSRGPCTAADIIALLSPPITTDIRPVTRGATRETTTTVNPYRTAWGRGLLLVENAALFFAIKMPSKYRGKPPPASVLPLHQLRMPLAHLADLGQPRAFFLDSSGRRDGLPRSPDDRSRSGVESFELGSSVVT